MHNNGLGEERKRDDNVRNWMIIIAKITTEYFHMEDINSPLSCPPARQADAMELPRRVPNPWTWRRFDKPITDATGSSNPLMKRRPSIGTETSPSHTNPLQWTALTYATRAAMIASFMVAVVRW